MRIAFLDLLQRLEKALELQGVATERASRGKHVEACRFDHTLGVQGASDPVESRMEHARGPPAARIGPKGRDQLVPPHRLCRHQEKQEHLLALLALPLEFHDQPTIQTDLNVAQRDDFDWWESSTMAPGGLRWPARRGSVRLAAPGPIEAEAAPAPPGCRVLCHRGRLAACLRKGG